jgi:hypothetical protein
VAVEVLRFDCDLLELYRRLRVPWGDLKIPCSEAHRKRFALKKTGRAVFAWKCFYRPGTRLGFAVRNMGKETIVNWEDAGRG